MPEGQPLPGRAASVRQHLRRVRHEQRHSTRAGTATAAGLPRVSENSHCAPNLCDTSNYSCVQCLLDIDCTNPSFPTCGRDRPASRSAATSAGRTGRCNPNETSHESYLTGGDRDNDPCLEFGYASYCPTNQWCQADTCVCTPLTCTVGAKKCDSNYPSTVYVCQKDGNGCFEWAVDSYCTSPQKCYSGGCQ